MTRAILVTGAAGFIGYHVAAKLLEAGHAVVGVDSLNAYYDPALKRARLARLAPHPAFRFECLDIAGRDAVARLFSDGRFPVVIHLAAQAGVRYSLEQPHAYADANLEGFLNILEGCRHHGCEHLIYASSSSVYGANAKLPFSVADRADHPISLYAASKRANELMAHSYSHLYRLPATGLRFFTIYGPWGRPDMAMYLFADAMTQERPIRLFNHGRMRRDFTYVDDVTSLMLRLIDRPPAPDPVSGAPAKVYNVGNHRPEDLMDVVALLESALGVVAQKEMLPMQPGDVPATFADIGDLARDLGFRPDTAIAIGVRRFAEWYREYHRLEERA